MLDRIYRKSNQETEQKKKNGVDGISKYFEIQILN